MLNLTIRSLPKELATLSQKRRSPDCVRIIKPGSRSPPLEIRLQNGSGREIIDEDDVEEVGTGNVKQGGESRPRCITKIP